MSSDCNCNGIFGSPHRPAITGLNRDACNCWEESRSAGDCAVCIAHGGDGSDGVPCSAFEAAECPSGACVATSWGGCEGADTRTGIVELGHPHIQCLRCGNGRFYRDGACHTDCAAFEAAPVEFDGRCEASNPND